MNISKFQFNGNLDTGHILISVSITEMVVMLNFVTIIIIILLLLLLFYYYYYYYYLLLLL